jgi:hypothetical protein
VSFRHRVAGLYQRTWRTYRAWFPTLMLLALVIFLPLGLLDAFAVNVNLDSLDLTSGIKVAAVFLAVLAITTTGLLGEIFFSGAIALSLTHPIKYGRLILVDVGFVVIVSAGLLLGIVPGVLGFVFLSLAGPLVEIEDHTALGALKRSAQLVRGSFWFVFWVVVPIELVGDTISGGLANLVHHLLGETFLGTWLAEALSNIVLSPVFAVAAVLLTVELIAAREGTSPPIHSAPVPA